MSGIAGIYAQRGQFLDPTFISTMMDSLAHRGPNGTHVWCENKMALGHLMLWTTAESLLERLPLVSQTGNLVITADARIDNRDELIIALELPYPPAKITDSQIILGAYEKWRENCSEHLIGAFAFAIWDKKRQSLFCSRDHFGVKPFYYHQSDQEFLFASEIKALLCLPQVPRRVDEVRIADYLSMMMEDKSITTYADIFRLPPAHCMQVSLSGTDIWSYWTLQPDAQIVLDSDEAYAQEFHHLFTEAVRCRLRSVLPIGSQLSGGLDSSAVTCTAQSLLTQYGKEPLHTISNIFDDVTECDERPYINAVLESGPFTSHFVHADQVSPIQDLADIWKIEDEAFVGPNHFLPWQLNRAAHQQGIRVFLDGFDGDTTVSHGVLRLKELASAGEWSSFCHEASPLAQHFDCSAQYLLIQYGLPVLKDLVQRGRWWAFIQAVDQIHHHFQISRKHLFWHYGFKPLIPKFWELQHKSFDAISPLPPLINRQFAKHIDFEHRFQTLGTASHAANTVQEDHWFSLTTGLLVFVLELLDRSAAAFSIEARHPFMDKRLIEFCLAVPPEQKLNQGWSRMIMRHALAGVLPKSIQWRGGKTSMTPNFLHGVLMLDRPVFDDLVNHPPQQLQQYIDVDVLQEAYHRMTSETQVKNADIMTVWQASILGLWLRHHPITP